MQETKKQDSKKQDVTMQDTKMKDSKIQEAKTQGSKIQEKVNQKYGTDTIKDTISHQTAETHGSGKIRSADLSTKGVEGNVPHNDEWVDLSNTESGVKNPAGYSKNVESVVNTPAV